MLVEKDEDIKVQKEMREELSTEVIFFFFPPSPSFPPLPPLYHTLGLNPSLPSPEFIKLPSLKKEGGGGGGDFILVENTGFLGLLHKLRRFIFHFTVLLATGHY
jgi:hypothetical protein